MKAKAILFLYSFLIWCLLNWIPDWEHMVVGAIVALIVTYVTGDLFVYSPQIYKNPVRLFKFFFYYLPLMFWGMVKAALGVARRILHPDLPLRPGIVKVRTTLRSSTALTYLSNTITLTSGTMVIDIDRDDEILYVHWIHVEDQDIDKATRLIVGRFEPLLKEIFE